MSIRKGSYTVEAALTMPLLLMVYAIAMRLAVGFYYESRSDQSGYYELQEWSVEDFYKDDLVGGALDGES